MALLVLRKTISVGFVVNRNLGDFNLNEFVLVSMRLVFQGRGKKHLEHQEYERQWVNMRREVVIFGVLELHDGFAAAFTFSFFSFFVFNLLQFGLLPL